MRISDWSSDVCSSDLLATFAGKRQPLGVGSGGMALLAKLDDATVEDIITHNGTQIEQYGGMSAREMRQLVQNTRTRGYAVVGNYAVRGALGVGCALSIGRASCRDRVCQYV